MQFHRATTIHDVSDVTQFIEDTTWENVRRFLDNASNNPHADHLLWLADTDGGPVASVQVFLHRYPIGCATVGVALPEYPFVPPDLRGRGHFKCIMTELFAWLRNNGYPLAYDHGAKGLYTKRGFAPGFHHCMVLIRVADALHHDLVHVPKNIRVRANLHRITPSDSLFLIPDSVPIRIHSRYGDGKLSLSRFFREEDLDERLLHCRRIRICADIRIERWKIHTDIRITEGDGDHRLVQGRES